MNDLLKTGIVIDERYQHHQTTPGHPECPERLGVLLELMSNYERDGLIKIEPRWATQQELTWNHHPDHVQGLAATAGQDQFAFDLETTTSAQSYEVACLAVGGLLNLLDAIMTGKANNGFAFVRPPGHHAEYNQAMGFCLFNNVAIGAHHLRTKHNLERVLILDWDVHHGNGTEHSFYDDPNVMYMSLHQWPHYPGTGAAEDVGRGEGAGFNVNIPLPAQCGDGDYIAMFEEILDPIARQFDPQFILISAGFDAHADDPLAGMHVSETGFAAMTRILMNIAKDHSENRCAVLLEGGYHLNALQNSAKSVLDELSGVKLDYPVPVTKSSIHAFHRVRDIQQKFWNVL